HVDQQFWTHFQHLQQVFLYLIDACNLRCRHCLYKPYFVDTARPPQIPPSLAKRLLGTFRSLGASKLTLMGGEPTLYGAEERNKPLLGLISAAKSLGYGYIRIDTNGMFKSQLLEEPAFTALDEVTFSLDGPDAETNDPLRGSGTFVRCVENIRKAVELGYTVDITSCVHRGYASARSAAGASLDRMIKLAESLGVRRVNLHPVFKMGIPRDSWSEDTDITPQVWTDLWRQTAGRVERGEYSIEVRIPQRFIEAEEFARAPGYYGYCSAKLGERVLVHPDGVIRACALLIGTQEGVARYDGASITWIDDSTNELRRHGSVKASPCAMQRGACAHLLPLCISFKPGQREFVWDRLDWEHNRPSTASCGKQTIGTELNKHLAAERCHR
ncbi:MAG TPA: radical SAM protein, partial [Phycisphaerae bacterium]|nr:radical SAM protein [Phycisphaerae bacterium]